MTAQYLRSFLLLFCLFVPALTYAQQPTEPPKVYTGNFGGGLAVTSGNTKTSNFNLTAALTRDPKKKNVIKGTAAYLRGDQNEILNLDRSAFNLRDEYTISGRT